MSITPKGYRVPLDNPIIKTLEKELKVKPFSPDTYTREYKVYRKSSQFLYGPRFYLLDKFGHPDEIIYHNIDTVDIPLALSPRDYQQGIADQVINHMKDKLSGVCSLYTGWGKTFLALYVAHILKQKTLIIVHTKSLLDQWTIKIKEFTGIDAGIIQQGKTITDPPICVGMIHSLCLRDYPKAVTEAFGLVIFDEVHHVSSEMFSGVFFKICIKYSLGLSATLKRADGLSKVINWFLGDTIVDVKQVTDKPEIRMCKFYPSEPMEEQVMINGKPNRMAMIGDLCKHQERNDFIINLIKENSHRVILVLTHIRQHAEYLHSQITDSGLYMGQMTQEALTESNKKNVIIGTYQMASEGYDNPRLDTLILATPKSDVEQSVGRILRQKNKNNALVMDIQDFYSVFIYMNYKRTAFYKKKGFLGKKEEIIEDYEILDELV